MERPIRWITIGVLGVAFAFLLSSPFRPPYFENQNTYLLHSVAQTGWGELERDWMANTLDPFPLFTLTAKYSYLALGTHAFYGLYALLLLVFFFSLLHLLGATRGASRGSRHDYLLAAALVILQSPLLPSFLLKGVAGQYLLKGYYQPSACGVFAILSIALFRARRVWLSWIALALAASLHFSYMLPCALLGGAYAFALLRERKSLAQVTCYLVGFVLLLSPTLIYVTVVFELLAGDPQMIEEARRLLYEQVIPFHADPRYWLFDDASHFFRSGILIPAIVTGALFVLRRDRLFPILAIPFVASVGLSVVQLATDSAALGLLFPWRMSAILVPICSVFLLWQGLVRLADIGAGHGLSAFLFRRITVALVAAAVVSSLLGNLRQVPEYRRELAVMEYVRDHGRGGQSYVVPPEFHYFRLFTGAPILADDKTHPYHARELLQWHRRLQRTRNIQAAINGESCTTVARLLEGDPVTHVVAAARVTPACVGVLEPLFSDGEFTVYRVE